MPDPGTLEKRFETSLLGTRELELGAGAGGGAWESKTRCLVWEGEDASKEWVAAGEARGGAQVSDHGSVPGGVQPGGEQAGGGRAGGTAGLLGGGGESRLAAQCHSRGCAQKPPVTTPSASTGWTICSTWPMESRGKSAPAPLPPAPPYSLLGPLP